MELKIDILKEDQTSLVTISGEIDIYTAEQLKTALLPLAEEKDQVIEVNFEGISYMDSTGLGVFINVLKATKEHESHLKLVGLNARILRLFTITGLDEIMDINNMVRDGDK